jgi:DNA-binding NarL/FixJ family response regulator
VNAAQQERRVEVLVVEDYPAVARAFCRSLGAAGYGAVDARSLAAARARIAQAWGEGGAGYAVVLLDLKLPDGDGEELLPLLKSRRPEPAVAVISGAAAGERALRLLGQGVWVVPKPIEGSALVALVERLCAKALRRDPIGAFCSGHGLSPKETEIVRASAEGLSSAEVAKRVGCSAHTTTGYWQRIFHKTGRRSQSAVFSAILRFAGQEPSDGEAREP